MDKPTCRLLARRDHHGRQRALGDAPRAAAFRRPPRRRARRPAGGGSGARPRRERAHAVRVLIRQLAAPARRGERADVAAAGLPAGRACAAWSRTARASRSSAAATGCRRTCARRIAEAERASASGERLDLRIALDYSSRDAIAEAAARWRGEHAPSRADFGRLLASPRLRTRNRRRSPDPLGRRKKTVRFPAVGSRPTPSSASSTPCGPISAPTTCARRSPISIVASGASAALARSHRWSRRNEQVAAII